MRGFIDRIQFHRAVQARAVPALQRLAANDQLRERALRRFDGDEPPPYESSTDSSVHGDDTGGDPQPSSLESLPAHLISRMEAPLDDKERDELVGSFLNGIGSPHELYYSHVREEEQRAKTHLQFPKPAMWRNHVGGQRLGVVIRHNVKSRWDKLGVWNPEWGFPGRNVQAQDHSLRWRWRWQPPDPAEPELDTEALTKFKPPLTYDRQLGRRILRLRAGLRRGEHVPVVPQSRLPSDAEASQAEAFLISRPWFLFEVEVAEEAVRWERVDDPMKPRYPYSPRKQVIEWWKERGDWSGEFDGLGLVTAWKWRHESPSPEPEDLTALDDMEDTPLAHPTTVEFTPSEVDALEAIEGPLSEQPESFWTATELGGPAYPGQWAVPEAERKWRRNKKSPRSPPDEAGFLRIFALPLPYSVDRFGFPIGGGGGEGGGDAPAEEAGAAGAAEDVTELADEPEPQVQPAAPAAPPPLRRSARIVGRKRAAEAVLLQEEEAPAKRLKRTAHRRPPPKPEPEPRRRTKGRPANQPEAPLPEPASRRVLTSARRTRRVAHPPEMGSAPGPSSTASRRGRGRPRRNGAVEP